MANPQNIHKAAEIFAANMAAECDKASAANPATKEANEARTKAILDMVLYTIVPAFLAAYESEYDTCVANGKAANAVKATKHAQPALLARVCSRYMIELTKLNRS